MKCGWLCHSSVLLQFPRCWAVCFRSIPRRWVTLYYFECCMGAMQAFSVQHALLYLMDRNSLFKSAFNCQNVKPLFIFIFLYVHVQFQYKLWSNPIETKNIKHCRAAPPLEGVLIRRWPVHTVPILLTGKLLCILPNRLVPLRWHKKNCQYPLKFAIGNVPRSTLLLATHVKIKQTKKYNMDVSYYRLGKKTLQALETLCKIKWLIILFTYLLHLAATERCEHGQSLSLRPIVKVVWNWLK